jgi:hypothetical protein
VEETAERGARSRSILFRMFASSPRTAEIELLAKVDGNIPVRRVSGRVRQREERKGREQDASIRSKARVVVEMCTFGSSSRRRKSVSATQNERKARKSSVRGRRAGHKPPSLHACAHTHASARRTHLEVEPAIPEVAVLALLEAFGVGPSAASALGRVVVDGAGVGPAAWSEGSTRRRREDRQQGDDSAHGVRDVPAVLVVHTSKLIGCNVTVERAVLKAPPHEAVVCTMVCTCKLGGSNRLM